MRKAKSILVATLFAALLLPATTQAGLRVYVRIAPPRPKHVHVVKVHRPHKHSIWVAGYWRWNGRKYVWVEGRWIAPRKGYVYVPGHWVKSRHGWYFIEGHWKKV